MGQYQRWLLAQETEKFLQVELEALETQILHLKERITTLEQSIPETENTILQVLLAYLQNQEESPEMASAGENPAFSHTGRDDAPELETPRPASAGSTSSLPGRPSPLESKPGDMLAFFAEQRKTNPDFALWSQSTEDRENTEDPTYAETRRLNENIQRWFERWHREVTARAQTEVHDGE